MPDDRPRCKKRKKEKKTMTGFFWSPNGLNRGAGARIDGHKRQGIAVALTIASLGKRRAGGRAFPSCPVSANKPAQRENENAIDDTSDVPTSFVARRPSRRRVLECCIERFRCIKCIFGNDDPRVDLALISMAIPRSDITFEVTWA